LDQLRRPFLIMTLVTISVALLLCIGSSLLDSAPSFTDRVDRAVGSVTNSPHMREQLANRNISIEPQDIRAEIEKVSDRKDPPGLAIPNLGLINSLLLLVLVLTALPMLIGDRTTGAIQGIVSIIGGIIGLIVGIVLAIVSFAALMLMVSLLLAVPFGTLAYLAIFGSFETGTAAAITTIVMLLQIAGLILLMLAQQRFLQSKGLMLLFGTAILLTFMVSLLHSIVPGILVSITDAIGGVIIGITGATWSLIILIFGIVAAVRLLRLGRQGGPVQLSREAAEVPIPGGPSAQPRSREING